MRQKSKMLKVLGISTAVFLVVSIPTYTYAKTVIGNNLLTTTVAAKKAIAWNSKAIFKKAVKVKKKLTVLGLTTLNNTRIKGTLTLDNGLALSSLTGLTAGQLVMGNAEGTPTATTLTGDVTVDSEGVTTLATDAVTVDSVAAITSEDGAEVDGILKYRSISSAQLVPLLNGESNTLTTFDSGTVILDIIVITGVSSGTVSTLAIGTDANWSEAASDSDAFIASHDLNASGITRMTTLPEVSPTASMNGNSTKTDDSAIMVQSSADVSTTDFNGSVVILYY